MESFTKYVIIDNELKADEHWDYCKEKTIPCITVTKVDEYYKIEMDMLPTSKLTDDKVKEVENTIKKKFENTPELKDKTEFSASNSVVDVYPIQKERIDEFCSILFEIGMK